MLAGKYDSPAGSISNLRVGLYTAANTDRSGFEKDVAVYCIRSVRPGNPHAHVSTRRPLHLIRRNATARDTTTDAATKGIVRDMTASSGGATALATNSDANR